MRSPLEEEAAQNLSPGRGRGKRREKEASIQMEGSEAGCVPEDSQEEGMFAGETVLPRISSDLAGEGVRPPVSA